MIKVSDVIKEILTRDQEASFCMSRGILNFSSYAREIHKEVKLLAKKEVEIQSVIVALSRMARSKKDYSLEVPITIENMSVHTNLHALTYEKTIKNLENLQKAYKKIPKETLSYFTITQSSTEITIIGEKSITEIVEHVFSKIKPRGRYENLAGVTVKLPPEHVDSANVIFTLIKKLAVRHINIIEAVSSLTELTFIIDKKDVSLALSQLTNT